MNSMKGLGLVGLLSGALTIGASASPQEIYGEHKGKIERGMMNKYGYSIELKGERYAHFLYREDQRMAVLIFDLKDDITNIKNRFIMMMRGVSPNKNLKSASPDSVELSNQRNYVAPSKEQVKMWQIYLDVLHQEDIRKEWLKKYGDKKK